MTRVLVVDDCAVDRTLAGEILKREAGFAIEYALSGEEALQQIERAAPDLVLTDLQMPRIDGLQLVSIVREKYPARAGHLDDVAGERGDCLSGLAIGGGQLRPQDIFARQLAGHRSEGPAGGDQRVLLPESDGMSGAQRARLLARQRSRAFHPADRAFSGGMRGLGHLQSRRPGASGRGPGRGLGQCHVSRQPGVEFVAPRDGLPTPTIAWRKPAAASRPTRTAASRSKCGWPAERRSLSSATKAPASTPRPCPTRPTRPTSRKSPAGGSC